MKPFFLFLLLGVSLPFSQSCKRAATGESSRVPLYDKDISISKDVLRDKIKGGWAGQVIGCTYGGPTEFRYCGTMIQDYIPIAWDEHRMQWYYEHQPGLYDDIYMDLTFVEVFEKEGLDAPAEAHAKAFANAGYKLWHANQAARYNILNGIMPPASGFWKNNPHADDIDFQIEADFAGLMSPGMVNTASEISDKVGHIMNYGDGWYGGVYVAAMYSLAFVSEDIEFIVKAGLKTIPEQSDFYKCISDVITWHERYPDDWKHTWFECEKKWSSDIGCPSGVFKPFDIDAKINSAYVVIGLLYGNGDYGKTLEIATRCGQDSDCNPATAGGILGCIIGYSHIPEYWRQGLDSVEGMDFKYTDMSLNDVYRIGFKQALENIAKHGGTVKDDKVILQPQQPLAVKYEKGFTNSFPKKVMGVVENKSRLGLNSKEYTFEFEGTGFVVKGSSRDADGTEERYDHEIEVYIDGKLHEKAFLPTDYKKRRTDISWGYGLEKGSHVVRIKLMNPEKDHFLYLNEVLIYDKLQKGESMQ